MNRALQTFRHRIRLWKNRWIEQYLHHRIHHNPDPYSIALRTRPYRVLWILSHMRSGSSLLTHILNTNPEIIGYGETHIRYQSLQDFKQLMAKVYWQAQEYRNLRDLKKLALQEKYILDKLLHNNKLLDINLLTSKNICVLFLVREPYRSLLSILDLKPHFSEAEAVFYYCNRLQTLVTYAEQIASQERALLIRHDQLIEETDLVLEALQNFLGTTTGFTEKYQLLKTTGSKHVGDHRGEILAGKIVRTQRALTSTLSQVAIEEAQAAYQDCCRRLSQFTTVVGAYAGA